MFTTGDAVTCPNCNQPTNRLMVYEFGTACARCMGMSEGGGTKIDGSMTRSASRIRDQQRTNEGDMITPHVFDKVTKKPVPNPDFVERYPHQLDNYFTGKELKEHGYTKLPKKPKNG